MDPNEETTTMTSSQPKADDVCAVCDETRENHGDKQHEFSLDGVLKPIKQGAPARSEPPRERTAAGVALGNDPVARLQVRLIERMVAKGLFDGEDLMYIFGNGNVSH